MSNHSRRGRRSTSRRARLQENNLAARVGGTRQPGSGNQWYAKGDVRVDDFLLLEAKQTDAPNINITKDVVEKIRNEAMLQGQDYWAVEVYLVAARLKLYIVPVDMVQTARDYNISLPDDTGDITIGSRKSIRINPALREFSRDSFLHVQTMWDTNFYVIGMQFMTAMIQGLREPEPFLDAGRVLYHFMESKNKEPSTRGLGIVGGSSMGYCKRKAWYRLMGVPPENRFEPNTYMVFQIGHAIHESIQDIFEKIFGSMFEREVFVEMPEFRFGGSIDGVVSGDGIPDDAVLEDVLTVEDWYCPSLVECVRGIFDAVRTGNRLMLEIKSCSAAQTSPDTKHMLQAHAYAIAGDCSHICFIYVNKRNGSIMPFVVTVSPRSSVYQRVLRDLRYLKKQFDSGTPPPREVESRTCNSCDYAHICNPYGSPHGSQ